MFWWRIIKGLKTDPNRQTSASLLQYLGCNTVFDTRHISSLEDRITSIKHCALRISSKMATIDEFVLKNIGLWWRYGISQDCDEWKYIIIGRIFESEIILIPPSLKISESSSNGSYRNTDEVWWRYGISRSCDEWVDPLKVLKLVPLLFTQGWTIKGIKTGTFVVNRGLNH